MTLTELLFGIAIGVFVLAALFSFYTLSMNGTYALIQFYSARDSSLNAMDTLSKEIRQATALQSHSTNEIVLINPDGDQIKFQFDPETHIFALDVNSGASTIKLLDEVESLEFTVHQRTPVGGSFEFFPVAVPNTGKLIDVHWTQSFTVPGTPRGDKLLSQMARIVMRTP